MKEPLRWPTPAIFAVVVGISLLVAEFSTYNPGQNAQQALSTLASIQAAVFAIVFSVVILGIQLSTSRYSTRLADLFRSDGAYKTTVGIFAVSLGVDVVALLALTHVSTYILRMLVSLAVCLSVASFVILYFFVDRTLEQTTPEGIIKRVKQELTPNQIISDAEAAETDPLETDPFLVPVSIIRSAIDDRDLPAAIRGFNLIDNQVEELLRYISLDQVKEETPVGDSLKELLVNRLPDVGEKSVESELDKAGTEVVGTISSIGGNAVEQSHGSVALHTSQGLSKLIANVDFDSTSETIRKEAMDESGELLKDAAAVKLWDAAGTGVRTLGWRTAQSIVRRSPPERSNYAYTLLAFRYIPNVLEKLVAGMPGDIRDEDIVIGLVSRDGEHASSTEKWALWSCYAAMAEATSAYIRYEVKHGEKIVDWMSVGGGWNNGLSTLNESNFDSLLRLWLGTILYIEYVQSELSDQYMDDFYTGARFVVPNEVLEQTFEDLLNNKLDSTSRIDLLPGRTDPVESPRIGISSPLVSEPDRSFEEWLKLHKDLGRGDYALGIDIDTIEKLNRDEKNGS